MEPRRPQVALGSPANSTIDLYIAEARRQGGVQPVALAHRRTLARRAALDLTGLPPAPERLEAFLNDDSPNAYDRYLDGLLASPAYGERWGRHWLDVARYADSNGLDENVAYGNAWRYRDYVIASLNRDKPYDLFVQEQLAGDLLPEPTSHQQRNERLIATGFLSLGPKVLAEVDETKMELDIIDEQVETTGRAFMALTLGCARCHDHKFDPISTEDYYSLAGIFKSTRTMEHFTKIARWNEVSLATAEQQAEHQRQQDQLKHLRETLQERKKAEATKTAAQANAAATDPDGVDLTTAGQTVVAAPPPTIADLEQQIQVLEASLVELPSAMAVADYEQPTSLPVHIRGSHLTLGKPTPRGAPQVLANETLAAPEMPAERSGRLELARWLTDPRHPLTARVIVNRVWRWHFGRGLSAATDNFGALGETPTHPELLDWLACFLVRNNWSLKELHREIMRSHTYQLDSVQDPRSAQLDPENRLYWRANRRRMEAEVLRDSLLAVAGDLDRSMGGSLLHVKNREFLFDHTSKDETRYNAPRRSVYLPVIRNHLYDVFALFDYNDASVMQSNRSTTTIAPQALFLLNGELPAEAAASLAARLLAQHSAREERLREGYQLVFGRPPSEGELRRDAEFLHGLAQALAGEEVSEKVQQPTEPGRSSVLDGRHSQFERRAWELLCQAWLASNEFIYVR